MGCNKTFSQNRSKAKQECREQMSQSLQKALGISVDPDRVRLKTDKTDDPYYWDGPDDWADVLSENLSTLSNANLESLKDIVNKGIIHPRWKSQRGNLTGGDNTDLPYEFKMKDLQSINGKQQEEIARLREQCGDAAKRISEGEKRENELQNNVEKLIQEKEQFEKQVSYMQDGLRQAQITTEHYRMCNVECYSRAAEMLKVIDSSGLGRVQDPAFQGDTGDPFYFSNS